MIGEAGMGLEGGGGKKRRFTGEIGGRSFLMLAILRRKGAQAP